MLHFLGASLVNFGRAWPKMTKKLVDRDGLRQISPCVWARQRASGLVELFVSPLRSRFVPILWMTDLHVDALSSRHDLIRAHIQRIRERGGAVILGGDVFDAMQGRRDPRSSKSRIRGELLADDYIDRLVPFALEVLGRDVPVVAVMYGNHELSVLKNQEVDLIKRLARELNAFVGSYTQFFRLFFLSPQRMRLLSEQHIDIYATHGSGSGAPITLGTIQGSRRLMMARADVYLSGHLHHGWIVAGAVEYVSASGDIQRKNVWIGQSGGYLDEGLHGSGWYQTKELRSGAMGSVAIELGMEMGKAVLSLSYWG